MRVLGLDIGEKTIGVAVSDPLGLTAQGLCTIQRKSNKIDFEEIKKYYDQYQCTLIIIGLPKNMNGTIGPSGERILKLSEKIAEALGVEIEMWDERLTTVAAHKAMLEADLSRAKRKKIVDKMAASYILQGYLDKLSIKKRSEQNG